MITYNRDDVIAILNDISSVQSLDIDKDKILIVNVGKLYKELKMIKKDKIKDAFFIYIDETTSDKKRILENLLKKIEAPAKARKPAALIKF